MSWTTEVLWPDVDHRHDRLRSDAEAWRTAKAGRQARNQNRRPVRRFVAALTGRTRRA